MELGHNIFAEITRLRNLAEDARRKAEDVRRTGWAKISADAAQPFTNKAAELEAAAKEKLSSSPFLAYIEVTDSILADEEAIQENSRLFKKFAEEQGRALSEIDRKVDYQEHRIDIIFERLDRGGPVKRLLRLLFGRRKSIKENVTL